MAFTYDQIASDFNLWQEYADRFGSWSRAEFDAQPAEERVAILLTAFGPEVPSVDAVLESCRESNGFCHWDEEGGRILIPCSELLPCLEKAYDSQMPNWPQQVELPENFYQ